MAREEIWATEEEYNNSIRIEKRDTAERTFTKSQMAVLLIFLVGSLIGSWIGLMRSLIGVVGAITVIYFAIVCFKSFLTARSLTSGLITVTAEEVASLKDEDLPLYSILVPLYKEKEVLESLVRNLSRLDYPKDKLQILLLMEADDEETIETARSLNLPSYFEPVVIKPSYPRTKPKALNIGLSRVRGEYCVIYDAEDRPETDQLKKAIVAFRKVKKGVVCIQAKLEYWNPDTNLLTKFFAAEYATYFNLVLPGLGKLGMPVPLGGTSNHFLTWALQKLGGWDSYNVTEDIDLGMRIARQGWRVEIMDSVTWEEANCHLWNWLRQRSRWIKGHMQTYFVHMRSPRRLLKDLGIVNFLSFQFIIGGTPLTMLFNPVFWILTIVYAVTRSGFIETLYPPPVYAMGVVSMVLGNFIFIYYVLTGCMIRELYGNVKWMLLTPLYWVLMSVGTWKALLQLLYKPHYWEKTKHGLVKEVEDVRE